MRKQMPVLFAAAIVLLLFAGCAADKKNDVVVINEVVSSNSRSLIDVSIGSPDWIELYNPTDKDINLAGYRLTDKTDSDKGTFSDATIKAGGYLVIYAAKTGTPPANSGVYCMDIGVAKGGEELFLVNPKNEIASQLTIPDLLTDVSYARRDDGTYGFCMETTPGSRNDKSILTDAAELETIIQAQKLTISEVLPKAADGNAWVELYNSGNTDVQLGNYSLTDTQDAPTKSKLPNRKLAAGEYIIVYLTGLDKESPEIHTSFKLGSQDAALYLYGFKGNLVSSSAWSMNIPNEVSVVENNKYTAITTKGSKNSADTFASVEQCKMDSADPVRLNEVLPKNKYSIVDSDGDRFEWVELYNSSSNPVSLSGYYLSDDTGNLLKWAFPDIKIQAKSYLVIFLSGKQGKPGEYHASFRLSEGETGIYLSTFKGIRVDALLYPATIGENISAGRDNSGTPQYYAQPTPGTINAKGFTSPALIGRFNKEGVYISEVCAANKAKSGVNDWIELYNGSSEAIDLTGCYLTDDAGVPTKWKIPSLKINGHGYAVIEASSDPAGRKAGTASFGISPAGETLILADAKGMLIDAFETGVLTVGTTSGRIEGNDAVKRVYFNKPTRLKTNAKQVLSGYAAAPIFSESGLYHTEKFQLTITSTTPDAKIYYTTDGSIPTTKSKLYTGPVEISKNKPICAVAYADGLLPSEMSTATFLFGKPHTIPVVCITGKPSDINFLLNVDKKNVQPEYNATIEYFEADGRLGVSFPSGIRPKGRSTIRMDQNSMTIALRSNYGQTSITYPFFADSKVKTFTTLSLRNSGQDNPNARIRDSFFQKVGTGMNVTTIHTRLVVVYINGAYYGLYDLQEEQNLDYFKTYYGIDSDNIDIINRNSLVVTGDNIEFRRIRKMAMSGRMADNNVFAEFSKYVDTDACIDYLVAQTYFGNGDIVNNKYFRARDYSVKWRPILFDLDFCLRFDDIDRNVFNRYFLPAPTIANGSMVVEMYIFGALRKNRAWCNKFAERYVELALTKFSPDQILPLYDELKAEMKPEMAQNIAKWHAPKNMTVWETKTDKLRNGLIKRQAIALLQMQRYFRISDATMKALKQKYAPKAKQ